MIMSDISEYQKVAALVCMDIDIMAKAAERKPETAIEYLRKLKEMKDSVVSDGGCRDSRYAACQAVFAVASRS